ncbi:MarR family winged helix-turn-helix transcriptional regulator [Kribbella sp. NBC_01245]|uniref:MarR family winged helix-turn-helix transcriptional regulator n=1 Tax=Kribbella sp. NBC_01245 TaxID=2903578 RepID=UPI002E2AA50A|nr:MarR family winged helix-turn-helix transcriptional regulator [Kribbella sp. NBC_01245]
MSSGLGVDDGIRTMLLLMPRLVGRIKRLQVPPEIAGLQLAPRHLSLFAYLQFDGPLGVNDLAARLEVTPATVSLMVGELTRKGILDRQADPEDRRKAIVTIAEDQRPAVDAWLSQSAKAWRAALEPLTPAQRQLFVETFSRYEREISES